MVASTNTKVFVASAAALYFKVFIVVGIQGGKTFRSGCRPPEDNSLSLAKGNPKQNYGLEFDAKDEKVLKARAVETRWRRMVLNDLESIPTALFVFGSGVLANANETVFAASMATFVLARYAHSYVYAKGLQPHRALAWFAGHLAVWAGIGAAVSAAFF